MCCVNTGSDIDYGLRNRTQILGVSIYNGTRLKRTKLNRKPNQNLCTYDCVQNKIKTQAAAVAQSVRAFAPQAEGWIWLLKTDAPC